MILEQLQYHEVRTLSGGSVFSYATVFGGAVMVHLGNGNGMIIVWGHLSRLSSALPSTYNVYMNGSIEQ